MINIKRKLYLSFYNFKEMNDEYVYSIYKLFCKIFKFEY